MLLLAPAPAYAPAGLRALLVSPWEAGASYVYSTPERDIVTELDPAATWWPVDCQQVGPACEFGEVYGRDKGGHGYQQTVTAGLPGLQAAIRAGLQTFIGRPLLALCQDMRGQWWLLGQEGALRLPAYAAKSGPLGGETLTSFSLTGRQPEAARQVVLTGTVPVIDYGGGGGSGSPHTLPFTLA